MPAKRKSCRTNEENASPPTPRGKAPDVGRGKAEGINSANQLTAADARAQRNEWSREEVAYRISKGKALWAIRSHCKKTMPDHWRVMVGCARVIIGQTWVDCTSLDYLRQEAGEEPIFREHFAIFHDAQAIRAVYYLAYIELAGAYEGKAPRFSTMRTAPSQAPGKFTLHQLRELLRDGRTPEEALSMLSDSIKERSKKGDAAFAKDMGDLFDDHRRRPEKFTRSTTEWIVRTWLTLRLYECPADGYQAYERARYTASLLEMPICDETQFLTAWRNVRSRVFGMANPYFSQSAGAD